jgi:hypothetical protein
MVSPFIFVSLCCWSLTLKGLLGLMVNVREKVFSATIKASILKGNYWFYGVEVHITLCFVYYEKHLL